MKKQYCLQRHIMTNFGANILKAGVALFCITVYAFLLFIGVVAVRDLLSGKAHLNYFDWAWGFANLAFSSGLLPLIVVLRLLYSFKGNLFFLLVFVLIAVLFHYPVVVVMAHGGRWASVVSAAVEILACCLAWRAAPSERS